MSKRCSLSLFLILALLSGCSTTSEGRRQLSLVSQDRIERDGARAFQRIKNRNILVNDEDEMKYLKCIVDTLTAGNTVLANGWEIALLRNDQPNAFALPGKKIAVNSGLLRITLNQDQLAAVISHEIAHIQAGHGSESTSQQVALEGLSLVSRIVERNLPVSDKDVTGTIDGALQIGLMYPMSKVHEEEADMIGLDLMVNSGFNPQEALQFWRNMQIYGDVSSDNFFSTHPSHQMRMAKLEQRIVVRNWSAAKDGIERKRPKCETQL